MWRRNIAEHRVAGLADAARAARPREVDDDEVQRMLAMTLERFPDGSTQWSVRRLAPRRALWCSAWMRRPKRSRQLRV
ncbi:MAG: helix-turn-helix domain-containing protein [Solirubrobacteraceae bacterium]